MAEEIKAGCARLTDGPVGEKVNVKKETQSAETKYHREHRNVKILSGNPQFCQ